MPPNPAVERACAKIHAVRSLGRWLLNEKSRDFWEWYVIEDG